MFVAERKEWTLSMVSQLMMMMVMTLGLVSLLPAVGPSLSLDLLLDASALTDLRKILDTTGKSKKSGKSGKH